MKLLAIVEFDHDGLHRIGDDFEVGEQFAKQMIHKGLAVEYSDKKAKELAKKKSAPYSHSVIEPPEPQGEAGKQEQSPPAGDADKQEQSPPAGDADKPLTG